MAMMCHMRPSTKNENLKYNQFWKHVMLGKIKIYLIDTCKHTANAFTKTLITQLFEYLRWKMLGGSRRDQPEGENWLLHRLL